MSGVSISLLGLIALLLVPVSIDDGRFIILSLFIVAYLIWRYISAEPVRLPHRSYLIPISVFGGLALLSSLWAHETSQALRHGFIWNLYLLYALTIAIHTNQEKHFGRHVAKLFSYLFLFLLLLHLGALHLEISLDTDWNELMSKGKNYSTTFLTLLSPYLLFYPSKSQFIRFSKVISIILLSNILFLTGARGALLAFAVIVMIKLWNFYAHTAWRFIGGIIGLAIIIGSIYLLNTSKATTDFTFVNEYRQELESRVRMNKNSIKSIQDHPLAGVGAGHWARDIYQYGIGDVAPLNNTDEIVRYRSYNAYFMITVEYGLIGFLLFFLPLFTLLFGYRHRWTELGGIKKGAFVSLVAWLIVIFFYATAVPYSYFFSGIALVGMTSLAILLPSSEGGKNKYGGLAAIALAIGCALWFSFTKVCHATFQKAKRTYAQGDIQGASDLYQQLYHPIFFASADYKESVDLKLAEIAIELGNTSAAKTYFERGLEEMPHSTELLYGYLTFLEKYDNRSARIRDLKSRIRTIQPNLLQKKK